MVFSISNYPGVEVTANSIAFDNENMRGKVGKKLINLYKEKMFDSIFVGYDKTYLGTILTDIAANFQPPKTLDLDLFTAIKKDEKIVYLERKSLEEHEEAIKDIFSQWTGKDVNVVFRCNDLVIKMFKL
jgi:hypothetical protein